MFVTRRAVLPLVLVTALSPPVLAQSDNRFDPNEACSAALSREGDMSLVMMTSWVFGYLAAADNKAPPVDIDGVRGVLGKIREICENDPSRSILMIVAASNQDAASVPGSAEQVRALLETFLQPGADIAALSARLFPTEADIRALYKDPLASALVRDLLPRFKPGVKFQPKPEHDAIFMVRATTDQLISEDPILQEFPGGYSQVLAYMKPGIPIVRFKFVKSGETLGLAFDGLVFVNGRWVLVPKPWGYLD